MLSLNNTLNTIIVYIGIKAHIKYLKANIDVGNGMPQYCLLLVEQKGDILPNLYIRSYSADGKMSLKQC